MIKTFLQKKGDGSGILLFYRLSSYIRHGVHRTYFCLLTRITDYSHYVHTKLQSLHYSHYTVVSTVVYFIISERFELYTSVRILHQSDSVVLFNNNKRFSAEIGQLDFK